MHKPRILVLTAAGKTGLPIALHLLSEGFPVTAFVRQEDQRSERLKSKGMMRPGPRTTPSLALSEFSDTMHATLSADSSDWRQSHELQTYEPSKEQIYP